MAHTVRIEDNGVTLHLPPPPDRCSKACSASDGAGFRWAAGAAAAASARSRSGRRIPTRATSCDHVDDDDRNHRRLLACRVSLRRPFREG